MGLRAGTYGVIKLGVASLWALLFATLIYQHYFVRALDVRESGALKRAREESFMGVYFGTVRTGYVKSRFSEGEDGLVRMDQEARLNLNVMNRVYPVTLQIKAFLTDRLRLRRFAFTLTSPFYAMHAEGMVEGKEVRFTLDTGKESQEHRIVLQDEPYLSTGERHYLLHEGLKPGDRVKIPYFDPVTLTAKDSVVEYKGKQKVLIAGRVHNLHHFVERYSGIPIDSWMDDTGRVIKEESPSGFVFIAEPEFQATDIVGQGPEILTSVSVPVEVSFSSVDELSSLSLTLRLPDEDVFDLDGGRQAFRNGVVNIQRETVPGNEAAPCAENERELAATAYVQSDDPRIERRVRELVEGTTGGMARVRKLAGWVFETVEKKPVLGIPDAVTTLATLRGDCNEHAALFAALARNARIPTRIVSGVMYHDGAFLYHAWNEVCIGNEWISIDTTKNQIPADVGHVRFVAGEVEDHVRIGALIGRLGIEVTGYR